MDAWNKLLITIRWAVVAIGIVGGEETAAQLTLRLMRATILCVGFVASWGSRQTISPTFLQSRALATGGRETRSRYGSVSCPQAKESKSKFAAETT